MITRIKKWLRQYFDYDIVGEYYDTNGNGHLYKKYVKKWHLRRKI